MLEELTIKNIAVIDKLSVDMKKGLTVLTGETGAGKSIIIDSINMILGERASKELIRNGCDKAEVEAVFGINDAVKDRLLEEDIDCDDNSVIISRKITADGKSTARINGCAVTLGTLRDVADLMVNIHGQHDNQALLTPIKHIIFLDNFAKCEKELCEYKEVYQRRQELLKALNNLNTDDTRREERIDLLSYQVNEIETAKLEIGEEEELIKVRDIMSRAEEIKQSAQMSYGLLYENDESSAYDLISSALKAIEGITDVDESVSKAYDTISEALYSMEDAARDVRDFADGVEYDPQALNEAEERLDLIGKLKRKYGGTVEAVIEYGKQAKAELDTMENSDRYRIELENKLRENDKEISEKAEALSGVRKTAAKVLSEEIENSLHELNMEKAKFSVAVNSKDYGTDGADNVEFMISANPGEELKPLSKIASGGELSRVMLAIKSILAKVDGVGTLIFDEIDTGVSGSAAQKIAEKLKVIAETSQVICITHLPQLAVAADNHFLIEKDVEGDMARTTLVDLNKDGRINEVARIVGGGEVGLEYARKMLG